MSRRQEGRQGSRGFQLVGTRNFPRWYEVLRGESARWEAACTTSEELRALFLEWVRAVLAFDHDQRAAATLLREGADLLTLADRDPLGALGRLAAREQELVGSMADMEGKLAAALSRVIHHQWVLRSVQQEDRLAKARACLGPVDRLMLAAAGMGEREVRAAAMNKRNAQLEDEVIQSLVRW